MYLKWMGEYREVVEQLIHYCNIYAAIYKDERDYGKVSFSFSQIQVVEYLLENEELNQHMSAIAARLGITNSTFSKLVNRLERKGMLEKYHVEGNRKNIVIKVSEHGREVYEAYSKAIVKHHFGAMFEQLNGIPKEYLHRFAEALSAPFPAADGDLQQEQKPPVLIPCEKHTEEPE